jgi:hypothetical protein
MNFKFDIGAQVVIATSGETGKVTGRSHYAASENSYYILYRAADGRATEGWWPESTLAHATPAAVAAIGDTLVPGQFYGHEGGIYIGTMPARGTRGPYALFACRQDVEDLTFGPDVEVSGATDHWDGAANTLALGSSGHAHPAADHCRTLNVDGKADWYLPAHAELCLAWVNCAEAFQKSDYYWSSTQYGRYFAWVQDFEYGISVSYFIKEGQRRVRPFRRSFI